MMMMAVSSVSSTPAPVVPTPATKPTVASNASKPAESLESLTPDELQLLNLLLASGDTVELSMVKDEPSKTGTAGKGAEAKAPAAASKKEATKKPASVDDDVKTTEEAKPSKAEESHKKPSKPVNFVA